jgi:hypothetical protein
MTCLDPRPDVWLTGRRAITVHTWGDGVFRVGIDLDSPECDQFLDFLEQERRIPQSFFFALYEGADWWKDPDDTWIGAIPGYDDDFVRVSPANTFDPVCPPPCLGLVPPQLPLRVLGRPRAHVVGVKFEQIFSRHMSTFLASLAPCRFGEVVLDNEVLQSHRRLFPQLSRKVLATDAMENVRRGCTACGSRILAPPPGGTPLGRRIDDLAVCRNEEGVGHLAAEHPVVVSVAVAQEMKKHFPRGYGLRPILDIDSPCGQRILHLFRRLQGLEAFREAESGPHATSDSRDRNGSREGQ